MCERIFSACTEPLEATYVIKIMTGELRIGLREGLVVDAVALAFARDPRAVRRAASAAGDLGAVALAAKHDALDQVTIAYHAPIAFMLASPIAYGSEYKELAAAAWLVEDKYDGIRAQAHVTPQRVSLFSRTLNDVSASYPEVVDALRALPGSFALDGELVAVRDGRVLPFRYLQARLQRKDVSPELLREVPVRYVAFDALARDDEFLLDHPLADRRARLAELLANAVDPLALAPWTALEADATAEAVHERFEASRTAGHEGLVFKRTDTPYTPGRRGKAWLKLKRELATLDCVVVAVERGHGKRVNVLSDYTFAVRNGGELAVIGKAYSGLTDVEIAEMTEWFEAHRLPPGEARAAYERLGLKRNEILVEPKIVVEIAFDIIQQSRLHASGYALRFPRIVRLRPDKRAEDADTLARVEEVLRRDAGPRRDRGTSGGAFAALGADSFDAVVDAVDARAVALRGVRAQPDYEQDEDQRERQAGQNEAGRRRSGSSVPAASIVAASATRSARGASARRSASVRTHRLRAGAGDSRPRRRPAPRAPRAKCWTAACRRIRPSLLRPGSPARPSLPRSPALRRRLRRGSARRSPARCEAR